MAERDEETKTLFGDRKPGHAVAWTILISKLTAELILIE